MPIATRLHTLRLLDLKCCHNLSAAMLEALLDGAVQGCSLRVAIGSSLSVAVCDGTRAAVASKRGGWCTPMVSHMG